MEKRTAMIRLAVAAVWIAIVLMLALAYRFLLSPQWKEAIQGAPELTQEQWKALTPVSSINAPPLTFARGACELDDSAERALGALVERLNAAPNSYVCVIGEARSDGDAAANGWLAQARANAAVKFLTTHGVSATKVHATVEQPTVEGAQQVRFVIGEPR